MSDRYDVIFGQLVDISPMSRPSTIVEALPIAGNVTTWVVQTAAHNEGFVTFLQSIDADGQFRLVLPAKVVAAIVRQQSTLAERLTDRRSPARKEADRRKAAVQRAKKTLAAANAGRARCRHCGFTRAHHVQVVVGGRDDCCYRDVAPHEERTFFERASK